MKTKILVLALSAVLCNSAFAVKIVSEATPAKETAVKTAPVAAPAPAPAAVPAPAPAAAVPTPAPAPSVTPAPAPAAKAAVEPAPAAKAAPAAAKAAPAQKAEAKKPVKVAAKPKQFTVEKVATGKMVSATTPAGQIEALAYLIKLGKK